MTYEPLFTRNANEHTDPNNIVVAYKLLKNIEKKKYLNAFVTVDMIHGVLQPIARESIQKMSNNKFISPMLFMAQ